MLAPAETQQIYQNVQSDVNIHKYTLQTEPEPEHSRILSFRPYHGNEPWRQGPEPGVRDWEWDWESFVYYSLCKYLFSTFCSILRLRYVCNLSRPTLYLLFGYSFAYGISRFPLRQDMQGQYFCGERNVPLLVKNRINFWPVLTAIITTSSSTSSSSFFLYEIWNFLKNKDILEIILCKKLYIHLQ